MPALRKSLDALSKADLEALIEDEWSEDELLEFKRTLSTADGAPDRWFVDQKAIGDRAKRELLAEVVAFANSYGGDLILGMEETRDKPPRAASLAPLPACVELAHRLELTARDLIKPSIPMLAIRGIPDEDGAGVVVIRVPRSREAPHRLEIRGIEKECYKRVRDRTETMSMREVQDLTINIRRGLESVAARISAQSAAFMGWVTSKSPPPGAGHVAIRVTATPASAEIAVNRVHDIPELTPTTKCWTVQLGNGRIKNVQLFEEFRIWRPMLRGTECRVGEGANRNAIQMTCDGTINYWTVNCARLDGSESFSSPPHIHPVTFAAMLLNAFETVERFRSYAGAHSVEYALDAEFSLSHPVPLLYWREDWAESAGKFTGQSVRLPTYALQSRDTWNDLVTLIMRDLYDAAGSATGLGEIKIQ